MTQPTADDLRWLDAAVRFASPYLGTTADNPAVAALVVDQASGTLIARAVTAKGGRPHAEAVALEAAGIEAAGRTLYVTLEPCHHWGRTPPCVDAVVRSGVMRVVIGTSDVDSRTAGESIRQLESAGIEVVLADHAPSKDHHAGHGLRHKSHRPYVTAILGDIGEHVAWRDMMRARSDAILVDTGSARNGANPAIKIPGLQSRTPPRVIYSGITGVDRSLNLISSFSGYRTVVVAETHAPTNVPVSVDVIRVRGDKGRPDLTATLAALAQRGMQNLLVEAGAKLVDQLMLLDALDCLAIVAAPAPDSASEMGLVEVESLGTLRLFQRSLA